MNFDLVDMRSIARYELSKHRENIYKWWWIIFHRQSKHELLFEQDSVALYVSKQLKEWDRESVYVWKNKEATMVLFYHIHIFSFHFVEMGYLLFAIKNKWKTNFRSFCLRNIPKM